MGEKESMNIHPSFFINHRCAAAAVAQLVEHLIGNEEVMGSSPISSS
jgi:hypothetical protein